MSLKIDDEKLANFDKAWKKFNATRLHIEKAVKLHDENQHTLVVEMIDKLPVEDIRDLQLMMNKLADSCKRTGNPVQAGRLYALASHDPAFDPSKERFYVKKLAQILGGSNKLKDSLDVMATVRKVSDEEVWGSALELFASQLTGQMIGSGPGIVSKKVNPINEPAWQLTVTKSTLNPQAVKGTLVFFLIDEDNPALSNTFASTSKASRSKPGYTSPDHYDVCVYDFSSGKLKWQKAGLMSGVSDYLVGDDSIYGMSSHGAVAASLTDGKVIWKDDTGTIKTEVLSQARRADVGRPWWKTFEMLKTDNHLLVWHPKREQMHSYNAKTGELIGTTNHNTAWAGLGQYFIDQPDGHYFVKRGTGKVEKLTDHHLADPESLTQLIRLVPDVAATIQNDTLFEVTRQVSRADPSQFDYYIIGSNISNGEFKWLYPMMSPSAPLIVAGKVFVYRHTVTGRRSTQVAMTDINAKKTDHIDLKPLEISLYEPTIKLPDGKGILIGSQAAISTNGKVIWFNRHLPVRTNPMMVGDMIFIAPMLVDAATGKILMELRAPTGTDWDKVTIVSDGVHMAVFTTRTVLKKGSKKKTTESVILAYNIADANLKEVAAGTTLKKVEPSSAKPRKKATIDEVQASFLASNISAPLGPFMCDLFRRVAAAKYEKTSDPAVSMKYLTDLLKTRPRNGMHLIELANIAEPYAQMMGEYDTLLAALEQTKKDYANKAKVVTAITDMENSAREEKEGAADSSSYVSRMREEKHDPLQDWPWEYPPDGSGNRGLGVEPPLTPGFERAATAGAKGDRVISTAQGVFVLDRKKHRVLALDPENGEPLWTFGGKKKPVYNFVYYRGLLYALGQNVYAIIPTTGTELWKKGIPAGEKGQALMCAGKDLIFVAYPNAGIRTYTWDTGRPSFGIDMPARDRIEVHGSTLLAYRERGRQIHAREAATGRPKWMADRIGPYAVYDGRLYSFRVVGSDKVGYELILVCYHTATGSELWRRHYDLPQVRKSKKSEKPVPMIPTVNREHIAVACGNSMFLIKRAGGDRLATIDLEAPVTGRPASTPTLVYTMSKDRKLTAYDMTNSLSQVWQMPISGKGNSLCIDAGTLFLLDNGKLTAFRGKSEEYGKEHLASLVAPNEKIQAGELVKVDSKITSARFADIGAIRNKSEFVKKMDDKRLSEIAFALVLNYGHMRDWEVMISELFKRLAPGERKVRKLVRTEERALFAEMIQRREPGTRELIRSVLKKKSRRLKRPLVLNLMTTGDSNVYGPILINVFRASLKDGDNTTAGICAKAIGDWRLERGFSVLRRALADARTPARLRNTCARAVGAFSRADAIGALAKVAKRTKDQTLARQCVLLLARRGEEGVRHLAIMLKMRSLADPVRRVVASALGQADPEFAMPVLIDGAKSSSIPMEIRAQIAITLSTTAKTDDKLCDMLIDQMNNTANNPYLRNAFMHAIGISRNPRVIPYLIEVIGSRKVDNRKFTSRGTAHGHLKIITREKNVDGNRDEWTEWWQENRDRFEK